MPFPDIRRRLAWAPPAYRSVVTSSIRRALSIACALVLLVGCTRSNEDLLEKARSLQTEGAVEESLPILIELIERGSRDGEVFYRYGRGLSLLGNSARSVWALDAALEDPDWFVQASQQLALDAYRSGNLDLTLQVLGRLREERLDAHESEVWGLILEARALVETGRHYAQALERASWIIENFPDQEEAVRVKVVALLGMKRPDEAYELIRKVGIPLEEKPADELYSLGEYVGGDETRAEADESASMDAEGDAEGEEEETDDLGILPGKREAYWCGVRVSFQRESDRLEEAEKIADECLAQYPASVDLIGEAVEVYSALGRSDRILEVLRVAQHEDPDNGQILDALIETYELAGSIKEAEDVLRAGLERATQDAGGQSARVAWYWSTLGSFLSKHGRNEEAISAYAKAIELSGGNAGPALLFSQAEALILAKRFDEALAIVEKTPTEVHRPMLQGRIAFERGQYPEALLLLDKTAVLWPNNAPVRYYLARTAEGLGDFDRAVEEYRQAMRADASLSEARERLAKLHLAEGNVREASNILQFQSPKKQSSPSLAMRVLMVEVQARLGHQPDLAIPAEPGVEVATLRRDTVRALSRGLRARFDLAAVEEVLARLARDPDPDVQGSFIRERVDLLLLGGRGADALKVAREAVEKRPENLDVQIALARSLIQGKEDLNQAADLLRGFREGQPSDVDGLISLGELALAREAADEAAKYFEQALALDAGCWPAMNRQIEGLVAAGRKDEAITRLSSFVARDAPYNGEAALTLARMLDVDQERARSIRLARQAIRFGAGSEAIEYLATLDSAAAAAYSVESPIPRPAQPEVEALVTGSKGDSAPTDPKAR